MQRIDLQASPSGSVGETREALVISASANYVEPSQPAGSDLPAGGNLHGRRLGYAYLSIEAATADLCTGTVNGLSTA